MIFSPSVGPLGPLFRLLESGPGNVEALVCKSGRASLADWQASEGNLDRKIFGTRSVVSFGPLRIPKVLRVVVLGYSSDSVHQQFLIPG
jgi:hypothetical protein